MASKQKLKKLKTFWLNLDFVDRDLHSSQRQQILQALVRQDVEVRANFNYIQSPLPIHGLDKIWMIRLRDQGLLGRLILSLKQQIILVKNLDVDIVVMRAFNMLQCLPVWFIWRKILRCHRPKFVLDIRSLPADFPGYWKRKQRQSRFDTAVRFAFKYFDGLTMITEKMKQALQNKTSIYSKEVCVWSSGVDPNLFNADKAIDMRRKLGCENRFIIMYHGILSPNRGLQQAVESIAIVKNDYPDVMLLFLGNGPALSELEERVRVLRLNKHVLIHPPVPFKEVPNYIHSIQAGLLPFPDLDSWNTSSPIKLNEYLAMGKPVIVTKIDAHRNALGDLACGFYIEDHRPESIAQGIETAIKKKSEFKALGEIARKKAIEDLTWDSQAKIIKTYFIQLLHKTVSARA